MGTPSSSTMQAVVGSSARARGPYFARTASRSGAGSSGSHHSRTCGCARQPTIRRWSSSSSRIVRTVRSRSVATTAIATACQTWCLRWRYGSRDSSPDRTSPMSADVWIAVALAALCGAVAGAASSSRRRGASGDDVRTALDVQAAELRRLADTAAQRELTAERLRQGLDGARRALEELRIRDQERRATDGEQREVVRRLATVLAGGASK